MVVVSHARDFLNQIVTDILELDNKKIKRYKGDYDTFERTKQDEMHRDARAKESSDKKRDAVQKFVAKNIGGGSKAASMAKSRQKMLDKMSVYDSVRLLFRHGCFGPYTACQDSVLETHEYSQFDAG